MDLEAIRKVLVKLDELAPKQYNYDDVLKKFVDNARNNKMDVTIINKPSKVLDALKLSFDHDVKAYMHDYLEVWYLDLKNKFSGVSASKKDFEDLEVALISGSIGIADSGSIIFFADYLEEALLTVPKKLIIFLGIERMIPSFSESVRYLAGLWRDLFGGSRNISIFSAPSRTGDIEKKVVMGAHGPREVHIYIMDWYRDKLEDKITALPHYRLLPLALSEYEKELRNYGGTIGLLDVVLCRELGSDVSGFIDKLSAFYGDLGIDISNFLGG